MAREYKNLCDDCHSINEMEGDNKYLGWTFEEILDLNKMIKNDLSIDDISKKLKKKKEECVLIYTQLNERIVDIGFSDVPNDKKFWDFMFNNNKKLRVMINGKGI